MMNKVGRSLRAASFGEAIARLSNGSFKSSLEDGSSVIGGGSAPEVKLPTVLVALEQGGMSASLLEERLRRHEIPIITRTERDRVMIDLRTVAAEEEAIILDAIVALSQSAHETTASAEVSAQTHTV